MSYTVWSGSVSTWNTYHPSAVDVPSLLFDHAINQYLSFSVPSLLHGAIAQHHISAIVIPSLLMDTLKDPFLDGINSGFDMPGLDPMFTSMAAQAAGELPETGIVYPLHVTRY